MSYRWYIMRCISLSVKVWVWVFYSVRGVLVLLNFHILHLNMQNWVFRRHRKWRLNNNFNVKARKSDEHILPKTLYSTQFCKISAKRAHARVTVRLTDICSFSYWINVTFSVDMQFLCCGHRIDLEDVYHVSRNQKKIGLFCKQS